MKLWAVILTILIATLVGLFIWLTVGCIGSLIDSSMKNKIQKIQAVEEASAAYGEIEYRDAKSNRLAKGSYFYRGGMDGNNSAGGKTGLS